MANPKDFLLNTDYELDKIILVKTGSFIDSVDIPHDLGFAPLPFGIWSTDEDFTTTKTLNAQDSGIYLTYTPQLGAWCRSDAQKIHLQATGDGHDTTRIYYRVYAFEPPNTAHDISENSSLAHTFVLNTDYNYRKIMATGAFTQSGQEYVHNLGYIPQVMGWLDYYGHLTSFRGIEPDMIADNVNNYKLTVTDTKIIIGDIEEGEESYYWRIYYDEA